MNKRYEEKAIRYQNEIDDLDMQNQMLHKRMEQLKKVSSNSKDEEEMIYNEIADVDEKIEQNIEAISYNQAFLSAMGVLVSGTGDKDDRNNIALN